MRFSDAYGPDKFGLSFELFPPKTAQGDAALMRHVAALMEFRPSFITCTYGAGGSTQAKTLDVVSGVREAFDISVATHLTCVGRTANEIHAYLQDAVERGVENVVALRGDPPKDATDFQPVAGGFRYANELVAMIADTFPNLGIAVAGYPEKHQEAPSPEADLENLKRKVDAGADAILTQLFYDNEDFFRFRDRCAAAGIRVPVVPGLLPVTNFGQIQRITSLCGAKLPRAFVAELESQEDDAEGQFNVGVDYATKQTQALIDAGTPGVHFYVLNQSAATARVLQSVTLPK